MYLMWKDEWRCSHWQTLRRLSANEGPGGIQAADKAAEEERGF